MELRQKSREYPPRRRSHPPTVSQWRRAGGHTEPVLRYDSVQAIPSRPAMRRNTGCENVSARAGEPIRAFTRWEATKSERLMITQIRRDLTEAFSRG
jgi:hypothetical protein